MSKENRDIHISNNAFELKVHVNVGFLSTQAAILLGCGALFLCSNSQPIRSLIVCVLALDFIIAVVYLFGRHEKVEDGEDTGDPQAESVDNTPPAKVEHTRSRKGSVKQSDRTIKNKVAVPNPNAGRHHGQSTPTTTQAPIITPTVDVAPESTNVTNSEEEQPQTNPEINMAANDEWAGFF